MRSALEHIESIDDSRYGLDFKAGTVEVVFVGRLGMEIGPKEKPPDW